MKCFFCEDAETEAELWEAGDQVYIECPACLARSSRFPNDKVGERAAWLVWGYFLHWVARKSGPVLELVKK